MKKLWLILSLLIITVLLATSCGSPKAIKPLTGKDIDNMVRKALENPEVGALIKENEPYQADVGWGIIAWSGTEVAGWYRTDYQDIADGKPPEDINYASRVLSINRDLTLRIGEPVRLYIDVIFDKNGEKIEYVNSFTSKSG